MSGRGSNLGDDMGEHELDASDDDYIEMNAAQLQSIQETLTDLTLNYRFFGKSSGANLIQTALSIKSEYNGTEPEHMRMRMVNRRPEFWTHHTVSCRPPSFTFCLAWLIGVNSGNAARFTSTPARSISRSQSQT